MPQADHKTEIAALLDKLAAQTEDPAYRRAAVALLMPMSSGRPALDDRELIEEAEWLVTNGIVTSWHAACCRVAKSLGPEVKVRSVAERLRRKKVTLKRK